MERESDASKQPGQQPSGYQQQHPGQQQYSEQKPPPTEEECKDEPQGEKPPEPCPPLPPPPDLCGPNVVCYGPPEWGDDPCVDLCKEPEEGQPWWKYPCKNL